MGRRDVSFPFRLDPRGQTQGTEYDRHVRDLIEQVLFTSPGERVNRPDFGTGLMKLVFNPGGDEVLKSTAALVQGQLQRWLGTLIGIERVDVRQSDTTIVVTVVYVVLATRERRIERFSR